MEFCTLFCLPILIFDVDGINPLNIEIILTHDFDFYAFSRCGGGAFSAKAWYFHKDTTSSSESRLSTSLVSLISLKSLMAATHAHM